MGDAAMSSGLNGSAIAMLIFGCAVLYGGIAICLKMAMRKKPDTNTTVETE
jgi:hypothetical protein